MTQQELARRAGISRSTVLHIVKGGHCGTDTLERVAALGQGQQRLAKALEVDVAELFTAPLDIGVRRDRMIAAVLRELSDSVSAAVMADLQHRRKRTLGRPRKGERLPFAE